jgi:baseplate hub protein gp41
MPPMPASTQTSGIGSAQQTYQYGRDFALIVTGTNLNGIDLSPLHCKFSIKRSSNMTPNCADIRVYNLDSDTALKIKQQYTKVIVQAGYNSNRGVIFKGNIKQAIIGRESATDTFIDLNCGDGDLAYNYAIVNTSVRSANQDTIFNQIAQPMYGLGVTLGTNQPQFLSTTLPRGKTMYGNSRDYLRVFTQQNGLTWSLQNEQLGFVKQQGYAPGVSVILTSKTGMIGTPQQTNIGVNVVCLINPLIQPGKTIKIDNASVAQLKIDLGNPKDPVNLAPPLTADGVYYVLVIEQTGDNRGVDWYSKLICCTVNPSTNPINSVPVSYGP